MTYEPRTRVERERDVIVTARGPNYGGIAIAVIVVLLVILSAFWLFDNEGAGTENNTSPTETTAPVETTVPADEAPATTVAP